MTSTISCVIIIGEPTYFVVLQIGCGFMNIQGLQKLTLLDFPGKTACTVFTAGCNLRCPFCHNPALVIHPPKESEISEDEFFAFLKKRVGVLDGVAITGGEPLMQSDIKDFIVKIRSLGYAVKLDTNGTFPEKLKSLVNDGLVDYVAMDVKAAPDGYPSAVGIGGYKLDKIKESIDFLLSDAVDYEFRTTVTRELNPVESAERLGEFIKGAKRHFLQCFNDTNEIIGFGLSKHSKEDMLQMRDVLLEYVSSCELRGV